MRVSVDANVLISFLLNPQSGSPPARTIVSVLQGGYQLCISSALIQEVNDKIRNKRDLRKRIPPAVADELFAVLALSAEIMQTSSGPFASHVRDPKDDYLIDHALTADVDYFVTGDRDLLELEHAFGFQIVSPAGFVAILDADEPGS